MIKYLIILAAAVLFVACGEDKTVVTDNDTAVTDDTPFADEDTSVDPEQSDDSSVLSDDPTFLTDDDTIFIDDDLIDEEDLSDDEDTGNTTDDAPFVDEDTAVDPEPSDDEDTAVDPEQSDDSSALSDDSTLLTDDDTIFTDDDLIGEEDLSDDEDTETLTDADLAPGTKTCYQINDCVLSCPAGNANCDEQCFLSGSLEGRAQYQTVRDCLDDKCSTECAPDPNAPSCEECLDEHCHTELLSCYFGQDDVPAYGILKGDQTSFAYIYDGDGDLSAQMQANLSGLVFSAVFTGAYGTGYHPVPPAADLTTAFAVHYAEELPSTPAHISIEQRSTVEQELVDPVVVLSFRTDALLPGSFTVDPTQMNGADLYLFNYNGTSTYCILAMGFSGTVNVTAALNTTAASGGSIALNTTDIKIYHPTETPIGDLSYEFATCPRE